MMTAESMDQGWPQIPQAARRISAYQRAALRRGGPKKKRPASLPAAAPSAMATDKVGPRPRVRSLDGNSRRFAALAAFVGVQFGQGADAGKSSWQSASAGCIAGSGEVGCP